MAIKYKLANLIDLTAQIALSDDPKRPKMEVRGLQLQEVIPLLLENRDLFVTAWAAIQAGKTPVQQFGGILATAPEFVAAILQKACTNIELEDGQSFGTLPMGVQLIAMAEVFKLTCPDPKRVGELLSEVMDLLRKNASASVTESVPQSNGMSAPAINSPQNLPQTTS
jgi:hypothetical protein